MTVTKHDVIVIGAGAAGLAAAERLAAAGCRLAILEARDRVGGRICTRHDPQWPAPLERGAEFVHGKPPETLALLQRAGTCMYDVTETHFQRRGKRLAARDFREVVEQAMERLTRLGSQDETWEGFLRHRGGRMSAEQRRLATSYVEGFNAADARVIGAQSLKAAEAASEQIEGDRLFRVAGGYDSLPRQLAAGISPEQAEWRLGTAVKTIRWQRGRVTVEATGPSGQRERLEGSRALITVPVGVLQAAPGEAGAMAFDPTLPARHREAIGQLVMGPVIRVLLRFEEPFWERLADGPVGFLHGPKAAFPTWWSPLPLRTAVLTGWAGGPAAAKLTGRPATELIGAALASLEQITGQGRKMIAGRLRGAEVADWAAEPWARGAYSYVRVGGMGASERLAAPAEGTLFFAGEATQGGLSGTVAGAVASGWRAAAALLKEG